VDILMSDSKNVEFCGDFDLLLPSTVSVVHSQISLKGPIITNGATFCFLQGDGSGISALQHSTLVIPNARAHC
jgi:hypothetical protein